MEILTGNYSKDSDVFWKPTQNFYEEANGLVNNVERRGIGGNVAACIVTMIISFVSITGNLAVIFVSRWHESLRVQQGNLLIVSLSVIDVLTGMLVMIPSAISVVFDRWVFGHTLCKVHATLGYWAVCVSSQTLTLISIDRAVAITYPLNYNNLMPPKRIIKFCSIVIFISFCIGLWGGLPNWVSYDYAEGVCAAEYTTNPKTYVPYTTACFICFYIPIAILSFCYTLIIIAARRSGKIAKSLFIRRNIIDPSLKEAVNNRLKMRKTVKSMIVVVVTYYLCFTPYSIAKQVKTHTKRDMPLWFNYLSTILIFISSATNPFIYAILRKDYRAAFEKLFKLLTRNL